MLERLKLLEDNVRELLDFKKRITLRELRDDKSKEWALRYGLLESIQIVIGVSCHIVSKHNLGNPATYAECIELLEQHKYIDKTLSEKLAAMIGLRNIPVHEYIVIDRGKLFGLLDHIGDFKEFAGKIHNAL